MKFLDNINELWSAVLQELTGMVSTAVMSTWIKTLVPVSFDNDCLSLETSSDFKEGIIDSRFKKDILAAAAAVLLFITVFIFTMIQRWVEAKTKD